VTSEQWEGLIGTMAIAVLGIAMAVNPRFALLVGRILRFGMPLPPEAAPVFRILGGVLAFMAIGILVVFGLRQTLHPGS
jgi:hypothetical protein